MSGTNDHTENEKPRVGLMVGSYNPPHAGHVETARNAKDSLGLSEVWLLPQPCSPLKRDIAQATIGQKLEMCEIIAAPHKGWLKVSDALKDAEPGYTGMLESYLKLGFNLSAAHPDKNFVLTGGNDNNLYLSLCAAYMGFCGFASRTNDIFSLLLAGKIGDAINGSEQSLSQFKSATLDRAPGSSTNIRELLQKNQEAAGIPEELGVYIRRNGLYRGPQ